MTAWQVSRSGNRRAQPRVTWVDAGPLALFTFGVPGQVRFATK